MAGEDPVASPGLSDIAHPKYTKDAHRRFKLSLGEWTESSEDEKENDPPAPLKKLKLSLKKPDKRWNFLTEVAESDLQQKYVAKNTFKATKWAHSNFTQWKISRKIALLLWLVWADQRHRTVLPTHIAGSVLYA